jgi:hypothetical protein
MISQVGQLRAKLIALGGHQPCDWAKTQQNERDAEKLVDALIAAVIEQEWAALEQLAEPGRDNRLILSWRHFRGWSATLSSRVVIGAAHRRKTARDAILSALSTRSWKSMVVK